MHQFFTNIDLLQISKKVELLNSFFAKQCSIIDNRSKIPSFRNSKADKSLSNIPFTEKNIEKVIQNLDLNKAHEHDMISIRMLKICNKSATKPLLIKPLRRVAFPMSGRKQCCPCPLFTKKLTNSY